MARIRTIKPSFFRHEGLFEAERETGLPLRIAFAGLWTAADREGRFRWRPRELKLDALPFDDVDFATVLDELKGRGFIVKYELDGQALGVIPSWSNHQVINNRESASELPAPPPDAWITRAPRVTDASTTPGASRNDTSLTPLVHAQVEGKGMEGNGKGSGKDEGASPRAPMTIAELVRDGLTEESAFGLLDMRSAKGLRVLMRSAWIEFKAKCMVAGRPVEAVVDHLIQIGGHLEGFQPEHLAQRDTPSTPMRFSQPGGRVQTPAEECR